jgi:hypothetical protein
MKTIAELETFLFDDAFTRIKNLHADTQPKWGVMNAQQMIEHLILAWSISNGTIRIPEDTLDAKSEKLKRIFLLSDKPLPRDFNNPILPKNTKFKYNNLEEAKDELNKELLKFKHFFENNSSELPLHNLFGRLSKHEWLWFHYKHMRHHMMQFDLIPAEGEMH